MFYVKLFRSVPRQMSLWGPFEAERSAKDFATEVQALGHCVAQVVSAEDAAYILPYVKSADMRKFGHSILPSDLLF